ncbi:hypothetical protein [Streptomyces sp. WM6378]|uniref:hypothetical protein n=1 Tax=Streptomyces sp. WM6378 TaxID=1415557 RepID=UPI000AA7D5FC|nr:hypothetical protein [Streptomyces sp. WM6378]
MPGAGGRQRGCGCSPAAAPGSRRPGHQPLAERTRPAGAVAAGERYADYFWPNGHLASHRGDFDASAGDADPAPGRGSHHLAALISIPLAP